MDHFHTRAKAADAIAVQLHPNDAELREQAAENYFWQLYDALCAGDLIGRDPTNLLPITLRDLAGAIAFGGCLISETDLNGWLVVIGIGVRVGAPDVAPVNAMLGDSALATLPSDEDLRAEQQELKDSGARNCNVILGNRYGVKTRDIKDACTRAKKAAKVSKDAVSGSYVSSVHKISSH